MTNEQESKKNLKKKELPRSKGRFVKGVSYSPQTQFKKGQHWRKKRKHWSKDWLKKEYTTKSASEIAKTCSVTEANILYWMRKHGIKRRSMSEIRKVKQWGCKNELNSQWKGDEVGYQALHQWITRNHTRTIQCEDCGKNGEFKKIKKGERWSLDWANISGKYRRDRSDWKCLCKKCHQKFDKK